jgi:hypothetical protein
VATDYQIPQLSHDVEGPRRCPGQGDQPADPCASEPLIVQRHHRYPRRLQLDMQGIPIAPTMCLETEGLSIPRSIRVLLHNSLTLFELRCHYSLKQLTLRRRMDQRPHLNCLDSILYCSLPFSRPRPRSPGSKNLRSVSVLREAYQVLSFALSARTAQ